MKHETSGSLGVLLLNLGGPDSLRAVKPFLFHLFSDREIIRLGPSFLQKPIAYLIASIRAQKTREAYGLIGGKSPICDITFAQANALETVLNEGTGLRFSDAAKRLEVHVAMRYWHPLIEKVVPELYERGIKRLIVLSLYPQYSIATTGSSLKKLQEVTAEYGIEIFTVLSWFDHPIYINALVDSITEGLKVFGKNRAGAADAAADVHVLFSAHSLPVKFIEEGDPYADQIKGTIHEVVRKLDIGWSLSFQSKSGPVQWLEPSTETMLKDLAEKGTKNILVVPISFVSDHIETLYEIDILYKRLAERLGMKLERVSSLNTLPLFISALQDIVLKGMKEAEWRK